MRTKLENLVIQWNDDKDLYLNFHYVGSYLYQPTEAKSSYERLKYHLDKYCKLSKKGITEYDMYEDKILGIPIFLTFPIGTVKKLADTIIPSESKIMTEMSEKVSKAAELTDSEFLDFLDELVDTAKNIRIDDISQIPLNLQEFPEYLAIRAEKLGWFR